MVHGLSTDGHPVIELSDVAKHYRIYRHPRDRLIERVWRGRPRHVEHQALDGISFSVGRGEKIGVIGRNGSGKSTLLQLIVGTRQPSRGIVRRRGKIAALLELGAGFNPEFTGRQNIQLNLGILGGAAQSRDPDRIERIIRFAEIGLFIDRPVKLYSSGMYLRLAFAVAIHVEAETIIIDEALAVGDFAFQARCLERLDELARAGRTIFFVSHDIAQVRRFCDRAIYLKEGRLAAIGDVATVCDTYFEDVEIGVIGPASVRAGGDSPQVPGALPAAGASEAVFAEKAAGRSGSRNRAAFRWVCVNDLVMEPAQIAFDDVVRIDVAYEVRRVVENLVVAFYVTDVAGQPILGSNSLYERHALRSDPGLGTLRIEFRNRLKEGEYAINLALATFVPGLPSVYEDHVSIGGRFASVVPAVQRRWAFYSPQFDLSGTDK